MCIRDSTHTIIFLFIPMFYLLRRYYAQQSLIYKLFGCTTTRLLCSMQILRSIEVMLLKYLLADYADGISHFCHYSRITGNISTTDVRGDVQVAWLYDLDCTTDIFKFRTYSITENYFYLWFWYFKNELNINKYCTVI